MINANDQREGQELIKRDKERERERERERVTRECKVIVFQTNCGRVK